MRICYLLFIICAFALLAVTGCAKKAVTTPGPQWQTGPKYVSGTCVVCGKQSDKMIDFTVPHGPNVKVCSPECAAKVGQNPAKYGGSVDGLAPK